MAKYKPDQGAYARTTAMWLLGALWAYGCYQLYYWLLSWRGENGQGIMVRNLIDGDMPVLGVPLTVSFLAATVIGIGGFVVLMKVLARPKVADMLIDSETEMRKCTWPGRAETFTSSVVILVVMLFFTALLAGMDFVLNEIMTEFVF